MSVRGRGRGGGRGSGEQSLPFHPRGRGAGGGGGGGRGEGGRGGGGGGRGRGGGRGEVEIFTPDNGQRPAPDKQVEGIENKTAAEIKNVKTSESNPLRPGYGGAGRQLTLWTNYFQLTSKNDLEFHRYAITIGPDSRGNVPSGKKAERIVKLLLEEHFQSRRQEIATDFRSTLIARNNLELETDKYSVTYRAEHEDEPAQNATQYRIRLQFSGSLTLRALINHLTSTQAGSMFGSKEEIIQALNIVVGHHPKAASTITSVGSNRHFDLDPGTQQKMDLGEGLHVIRGFFMSVRAATARVLVNVQVKNTAFYDEGPLDTLMNAFMPHHGYDRAELLKFVKRLSVDATHLARRNKQGQRVPRIKTIQGFATKDDGAKMEHPPLVEEFGAGAKDVKFFLDAAPAGSSSGNSAAPAESSGTQGKKGKKGKKAAKAGPAPPSQGGYTSVFDYFKQQYNITIRDPTLPVVNVGVKDHPSYLPAQVCEVRPGQPAKRMLSPTQTKEMIRFAVRQPAQNANSIVTTGARLLGFEPANQTLNAFDVNVAPRLTSVPGRVLTPPLIKYSGATTTPRFGSWDLRSVKFVTKADMPRWTYLRISLEGERGFFRDDQEFTAKLNEFQEKLRELGISLQNYMAGQHITVTPRNLEAQIDDSIHRFAIHQSRPTLILVIVPQREMTAVYNRIKYACDVKEGILNVCVLDSKFWKADPQYLANVALKFNLKLGGRNHSLEPSKLGFLQHKKTMVVGIDVTHPSPGSSPTAPSVAGIVASVDESLGQWPADIQIQPPRQEMVAGLAGLLKSRLQIWRERNRALPENILVYRDGVSEGQYDIVLDKELPALREACKELYPAEMTKAGMPRITIVIVGKRHNTRFYPTRKDDADRSGNPPNGTVVDRGITEARNWDFFLQAHAPVQGTARPCHYYVIYDQIFHSVGRRNTATDSLEDLTHNLCYLFGRATKAVSSCPPAYYADLVCTRARCYLSSFFDPSSQSGEDVSTVGSSAEAPSQAPDFSMVAIHPNIKNTMFYI